MHAPVAHPCHPVVIQTHNRLVYSPGVLTHGKRQSGRTRLFLLLLLLAVVAAGTAVPIVDYYVLTPERVRTTIVPILEQRIGRRIELEDANISWRGLTLTGVEIAEDESFEAVGNTAVIRADRMALFLNPLGLYNRQILIEQLYLENPEVTLSRDANDLWNFASMGDDGSEPAEKKARDERKPQRADKNKTQSVQNGESADGARPWTVVVQRMHIAGGAITYFDAFERIPGAPMWSRLDELNLRMKASGSQDIVEFDLHGRLRGSLVPEPDDADAIVNTPISIAGPVDLKNGEATLSLDADEIDIDAIVDLFRKDPSLPKVKHEGTRLPFDIDIDVTARRVLYEGYRFEEAAGRIRLDGLTLISGDIDAGLSGGTANVTALFDLSGEGVSVGLTAKGKQVDAGQLLQRFHREYLSSLAGKADINVQLAGKADRFSDAFKAAAPGRRPPTGGTLGVLASFDLDQLDVDRAYLDIMDLLSDDVSEQTEAGAPARPPVDLSGLEINASIRADHAQVQGIGLTELRVRESLNAGRNVARARAKPVNGRDASIDFEINFSDPALPYEGRLVLEGLKTALVVERYTDLKPGNTQGRMNVDLELSGSLRGAQGDIVKTLLAMQSTESGEGAAHARLELELERLDLESLFDLPTDAQSQDSDSAVTQPPGETAGSADEIAAAAANAATDAEPFQADAPGLRNEGDDGKGADQSDDPVAAAAMAATAATKTAADHLDGPADDASAQKHSAVASAESESDEVVEAAAATQPDGTIGPYNTGALRVDLQLEIGETALHGYVFENVLAEARLFDSRIQIDKMSGEVAGGTFDLTSNIALDYPGLMYDARIDIQSADIPMLLSPMSLSSFGNAVGVMSVKAHLDGHGTTTEQALESLSGAVEISVPQARFVDSDLFHQIEKATGITGFQNFQVRNSGGRMSVAGGRLTTERILVGGDEARIIGEGQIGFDGKIDFSLSLGFGPDSRRRLLAPGIILPYSVDRDGWTNIPLRLGGEVGDAKVRVPVDAYAGTAVRAAPDAAIRLITEGAGTVTGGGGMVLQGGRTAVGVVFDGLGSVLGTPDGDGQSPGNSRPGNRRRAAGVRVGSDESGNAAEQTPPENVDSGIGQPENGSLQGPNASPVESVPDDDGREPGTALPDKSGGGADAHDAEPSD